MARRRVMLAGGKKPRLPREYQEVEHLESTGTQYIITGIPPKAASTTWELDFKYTKATGVMGANWNNGSRFYIDAGFGYGLSYRYSFGIPFDTNRHQFRLNLYQRRFAQLDDNEPEVYNGNPAFTEGCPITLFARSRPGAVDFKGYVCVYSSKIYESGELVQDLIPCVRKSDSKPGMYDLCGSICTLTNSPFYINAGTGEFLVGPDVN